MSDDSHYTHKEPCPKCGSRDNLARYTDGHGFCFGCRHYEPATDGSTPTTTRTPRMSSDFTPIQGEYMALAKRNISEDTCRHFGYTVGDDPKTGKPVQLAPYYNADGQIVAQKVRTPQKDFTVVGKLKDAL